MTGLDSAKEEKKPTVSLIISVISDIYIYIEFYMASSTKYFSPTPAAFSDLGAP